jgi:glycosyltransferase involved in cell wall biosynthesis
VEEVLNPKKILIVAENFYPEEFKINEVALQWKEKGCCVDVVTQFPSYPHGKVYEGYTNRWYQKDSYKGINIYRVKAVEGYKTNLFKKILKYFSFMILGSIVTLRIGKRYDYVFGFGVGAQTSITPAVLLQKIYKKRVVLWIHDIWPDSVYAYGFKKTKLLSFFLDGFVRFVYANSSALAISSRGFRGRIKSYIKKDKEILYAPNWADDLSGIDDDFSFSSEKKVHFTFAGNVGKVQNLDNVIRAFGKVDRDLMQKIQLNIIGDGSCLEELKRLVKNDSISNVVFWGRKPRGEMQRYFNASDFLIVSLVDKAIFSLTVPAKLQTYIAAKKPIVAILKGETAMLVRENKLGFCVEPDDIEAITKIFIRCAEMKESEKNIFTKNAQKLTQTIFNKEKIVQNLLNLTQGNHL